MSFLIVLLTSAHEQNPLLWGLRSKDCQKISPLEDIISMATAAGIYHGSYPHSDEFHETIESTLLSNEVKCQSHEVEMDG